MKWFEFFLPMILLVSLLTPVAHADGFNINIDVSGIIGAVNGNTQSNANVMNDTKTTLNNSILGLPIDLFGLFTGGIKNSFKNFNNSLLDFTGTLLTSNPDPNLMLGFWQTVITVISCFYLLIFLIIGLAFLVSGANIQRREQAKDWLKRAIMMIIGVNISYLGYALILELSTAITKYFWETGFAQLLQNSIFTSVGLIMLIAYSGTIFLALITLFIRYLFLLVGVALFPIGIFLYFTPKVESWGKLVFSFLGTMLAMQLVDVIILVATTQLGNQLGDVGAAFIPMLGFVVIAIANIFMMGHAIMKSATKIADSSPMIGMAVGALTGQIGSLVTAIKPAAQGASA